MRAPDGGALAARRDAPLDVDADAPITPGAFLPCAGEGGAGPTDSRFGGKGEKFQLQIV